MPFQQLSPAVQHFRDMPSDGWALGRRHLKQPPNHIVTEQEQATSRSSTMAFFCAWRTQRTGRIYLTKQPAQQPIASRYPYNRHIYKHIYKHDATIPPTLPNAWVNAGHSLALLLVAAISSVGPPPFPFRHPRVSATCSTPCGRASLGTPWRARVIRIQCIYIAVKMCSRFSTRPSYRLIQPLCRARRTYGYFRQRQGLSSGHVPSPYRLSHLV